MSFKQLRFKSEHIKATGIRFTTFPFQIEPGKTETQLKEKVIISASVIAGIIMY